jgi:copper chaperone CopZ
MRQKRAASDREALNMVKTTVAVDGMMCGMCESHINEVIRKNFKVKKVAADRSKAQAVIVSEETPDPELLKKVIGETGYTAGEIRTEPYEKKGLFGLW